MRRAAARATARWRSGSSPRSSPTTSGRARAPSVVAKRNWQHIEDLLDVTGARVLILGYGSIGRAVRGAVAAVRHELCPDRASSAYEGVHSVAELSTLLPEADVIIDLLPLTHETRGLIDAEMLSLMHDGGLLVNAGRGATVDTASLIDELARRPDPRRAGRRRPRAAACRSIRSGRCRA